MKEKNKIGILTLILFFGGLVVTMIDAVVTVNYEVIPSNPSTDFHELVINGPIWWKINPIIILTIMSVGILSFLVGNNIKLTNLSKELSKLLPTAITFVTISFSGLGDVMSQTIIEWLRGNNPLNWLKYEWWWTRFMPLPALVSFMAGRSIPLGTDMIVASFTGIAIIGIMWLHYYEKISFAKVRNYLIRV